MKNKIRPCLWFDNQAEEAVKFYTSIFRDSKIEGVSYYGKEGFDIHHQKEGTVLTIEFEINGQSLTALNGGPAFQFNESISLQVFCDSQQEIDYYWDKLIGDGGEESYCGWLKDKYGLSWQIVPSILSELMKDPVKAEKIMSVFMEMRKFDLEKIKNA